MSSSLLLSLVTFVYLLAALAYGTGWLFRRRVLSRGATWVSWLGVGLHGAGMVVRWVESYRIGFGHAPLS
ncbi:MAG: c-type cytochrome biogenesis protein CcsB, partial [Nitrospirota bacterium]